MLDGFDVQSRVDQSIDKEDFWGFTYAWANLTIGAHACPALKLGAAQDFIVNLRELVGHHPAGAGALLLLLELCVPGSSYLCGGPTASTAPRYWRVVESLGCAICLCC